MFESFPVSFARPMWLLALAAIPWMVRLERRGFVLMSRRRARWARWLRVTVLTALTLALAGLQVVRVSDELTVIFLLDRSDSARGQFEEKMGDLETALQAMAPSDRAGLVVFGADSYVEVAPGLGKPELRAIETDTDTTGSDLSRAIRLGLGLFPDDTQRRLALVTDGNENLGDALEEAKTAAASNVPIDVIPISREVNEEILVEDIELPEAIDKDEPFETKITVRSTDGGPATLRLFKNGKSIGKQEVELKPGKNVFAMQDLGDKEGFFSYEATIDSLYDTMGENNKGISYIRVHGKPQILLVGPEGDTEYIQKALSGENWDVEVSRQLPRDKIEAERYDAIFLANAPSEDFSNRQLSLVRDYVRDLAGGFAMIGGENSFGVGGYANTGVEEALPVSMELKNKRYFPSLALSIVMDKSGSMGETTGGGVSKMDLANIAAVEAIKLLNDQDLAQVIAFDGSAKKVWGLNAIGGYRNQLESDVLSIRPGGGTDMYVGMEAAYEDLAQARSQLKHMIVLGDGMSQGGNFAKLAQQCLAAKITVTTVAIGAGADTKTMQLIATLGGGRYYETADPSRVPRIFAKETYIAQKAYLIEEDFHPAVFQENQIIKGISGFPIVKGYVVTEPKDRAETVLLTHKEEPLLSTWRFGLGKSVAFTSDAKARWLRNWIGWEGFTQFWVQMARWVLRGQERSQLHPRVEISRGKGKVVVDAVSDDDDFINFLDLSVRVSPPEGEGFDVPLKQSAPGRYEGEFDARDQGAYLALVHGAEEQGIAAATTGFAISYPAEYRDFSTNELLLRQVADRTGGRYDPSLAELFERDQKSVKSRKDMWFWLLLVAIALFPFDVAIRRVFLDQEQIAAIKRFFGKFVIIRRQSRAAGDASLATIEALKKTRGQARKGRRGQASDDGPDASPGEDAPIRPASMKAPDAPASGQPAAESEAVAKARAASLAAASQSEGKPPAAAAPGGPGTLSQLKKATQAAKPVSGGQPSPTREPGKPLIIPSVRSSDAKPAEEKGDDGLSHTERLLRARNRANKRK